MVCNRFVEAHGGWKLSKRLCKFFFCGLVAVKIWKLSEQCMFCYIVSMMDFT